MRLSCELTSRVPCADNNQMLIAATYVLHMLSFPAGWSTPAPDDARSVGSRPAYAAMGSNGAVAVILANKSIYRDAASGATLIENPAQRVLILRSDGTTTILRSPSASLVIPRFPTCREGTADLRDCPFFSSVVLAADGTPFVTFSTYFSGAYSGSRDAALTWDGSWHRLQRQNVLHGLAKPEDPSNLSIAAADTPEDYAFVGNYHDFFPMEDLDKAGRDPLWMADVSGVTFSWGSVALGIGNATAIRGSFVAGFDGGLKLVAQPNPGSPATALRWHCIQSIAAVHPCDRRVLGPGVAYAVDSSGDVVGDDEPRFGDSRPLHSAGRPVLWRSGEAVRLSSEYGAAYAIAESGAVVGTFGGSNVGPGDIVLGPTSGFIADARERHPHAVPLDPLVNNLGGRHVVAAFGIANDGRILAIVGTRGDKRSRGKLAILTPQ